MMAAYSEWILDENDNKNSDSSDHCQTVVAVLRSKFYLESKSSSTLNNEGFYWTEDMFESQFQVLSALIDENDFERANVISFGILMEIEKILNVNEGRSTNNFIVLNILKLCFRY